MLLGMLIIYIFLKPFRSLSNLPHKVAISCAGEVFSCSSCGFGPGTLTSLAHQ